MDGLAIGVVGAGTAGAAAATLLARAGHAVTVFEQVPAPRAVGAGLLLQPTGLAALAHLGVLDGILRDGAPVRRLRGETPRGRAVMDLAYEDLRPGLHGVGVHRGRLFRALFDAMGEAGADVRCGIAVTGVSDTAPRSVRDAAGGEHGPFDLVVVADGARSRVRAGCGLVARDRPYPWGALWFIAEDPDRAFGDRLFQVYRGTRKFVGFLPTGRLAPGTPDLVSFFWSVRLDRVDAWRARGLGPWRDEVLAMAPCAAPVLAQIEDPAQLIVATYRDVVLRATHAPGLVVLGDAAHATSPQLGQGANLALEDAQSLADALAAAPALDAALAAHDRARRASVSFYQWASRRLTPLWQSGHTWLGPLRDTIVPWSARVPWLRRQFLAAMAGLKSGLLGVRPVPEWDAPGTGAPPDGR